MLLEAIYTFLYLELKLTSK